MSRPVFKISLAAFNPRQHAYYQRRHHSQDSFASIKISVSTERQRVNHTTAKVSVAKHTVPINRKRFPATKADHQILQDIQHVIWIPLVWQNVITLGLESLKQHSRRTASSPDIVSFKQTLNHTDRSNMNVVLRILKAG